MSEMELLVEKTVEAIIESDGTTISDLFSQNRNELSENGWTFTTKMNEALEEITLTSQQCSVYNSVLEGLSECGNPKELVFAFLESCEVFKNESLFHQIVPHLTQQLLKLPGKHQSLELVCDTLYSHVKCCPWANEEYAVTDKGPGDNTELTITYTPATKHILMNVSTFTEKLLQPIIDTYPDLNTRELLSKYLLKVLHYPLLYIYYDESNDNVTKCIRSVVDALSLLNPTITTILIQYPKRADTIAFAVDKVVDNPLQQAIENHSYEDDALILGAGSLSYIILYEKFAVRNVPQIFSKSYRLMLLLPILNRLYLQSSNSVVELKAMRLLTLLMKDIDIGSLDQEILECPQMRESLVFISWSMQFSDLLTTRQSAAKLLPLIISRFNYKAKYYILLSMLNTGQSSEVMGYVYTLVKDFIHEGWTNDLGSEKATYSLTLMKEIFQAPKGEHGNILTDLNKISSALNLARYLVMRDKQRTAVYTKRMSEYLESYIIPVGQYLKSELSYLEDRLMEMDQGNHKPSRLEVNVGGETFDDSITVQREGTVSAIQKVNLVLYVHSCLEEALND